jgi:starch synthase
MDLGEFAQQHPTQFAFINGFSSEHAHLVEAGADFFLMPSQFEPCGLNQMYSLAYGTVPIVRSVGGLKDTVIDHSHTDGTGFVFDDPTPCALLSCIRRALLAFYEDPAAFRAMQIRGMNTRFTWESAAQSYQALYKSAV